MPLVFSVQNFIFPSFLYNLTSYKKSSGFRVQGSGFRVQGSGFRVQGLGFRV
jgi:hypothetical protein